MNKTDEIEIGDLVCYKLGAPHYTGILLKKNVFEKFPQSSMADVMWVDGHIEKKCFLNLLKKKESKQ